MTMIPYRRAQVNEIRPAPASVDFFGRSVYNDLLYVCGAMGGQYPGVTHMTNEKENAARRPGPVSRACFRVLRKLVQLCYPRIRVEGAENLPDAPCIIVGNHAQMHGPICCEFYLPGKRRIWCAGEMMELKAVPPYAYKDFWSGKPRSIRWLFKLCSYLIAPIAVCVFNNAFTIPVYHDTRILKTFRQTFAALDDGANVVIFPECATPDNNIVYRFQDRFVDVAKMYYKRSGKALSFVPMYVAPRLKTLYLGPPVVYDPDAGAEAERSRICQYLSAQITATARSLPEHIVVPYSNISKKLYPTNHAFEEAKDHEKTCC